jgi:hypothetical protein
MGFQTMNLLQEEDLNDKEEKQMIVGCTEVKDDAGLQKEKGY